MEHKKKGLMIGISTNQNSTNLIPFLQSGCDTLILLETDLAIEKEWAKGFGYIAEERGKSFKTVAIGEGLDLEKIMNVIEEHIKDLEGDIYWNIGGGQKMQTFSMVMSFQKRIAAKYCDYIYYTEPQSRKTVQINYKEGQMQSRIDRTCVPDLKLEEINKIFGYKVSSPKKQILLWQRTGEKSGKLYKEKMLTDEQFDFFMNYDNRQKMFKYTYEKFSQKSYGDPEISCGDPEIIFGDLYDFDIDKKNGLFGLYFERMMQKKIARIVSENPASHRINQVWSVEITSTKTADTKQEFDVLLVTDFGTLISLDAKTFEFRKKDEDARTLNLYRASGFYTDFYSVFPFLHADLSNKESQLNSNAEWKKMKNRPYEIKRRDGKMLAFCEDEAPDLVLTNEKERPTDFELKKLSDMLACLNLLC